MILQLLLLSTAFAIGLMTILWLVQRRTGNAGIVDVGWSASIPVMAVLYAILADGDLSRRIAGAVIASLWGFRLAWHIHSRSHGKPEDGRYTRLREEWAPHVQTKMLRFYLFQALAAVFFSVPFLCSSAHPRPGWTGLEWVALFLWTVAWIGESVADAQLEAFKRRPDAKGKTCRTGLWRYSRHPNYFFEWLIWCAFALFAVSSPFGWIAIACPLLIYHFLTRVTGIPATEAQAVRSRGADYIDYQRTTNMFFPWFPRT